MLCLDYVAISPFIYFKEWEIESDHYKHEVLEKITFHCLFETTKACQDVITMILLTVNDLRFIAIV